MQVQPYLTFPGRCEEAVELYRTALGAEGLELLRFKDAPEPLPAGMLPPGFEDKILHGSFRLGDAMVMVSDVGDEASAGPSGFSLAVTVPTEDEADRTFGALAEGGRVGMPLGKTFWSPRFGMVTDRFGVSWMINTEPPMAGGAAADDGDDVELSLTRIVDAPRDLIWKAWTTPELLMEWFAPSPWTTVACEIDLRPGGMFRTVMRSPEGQDHPGAGCILEVVENERLVWTDALAPGYRPAAAPFFTAIITLEDHAAGTRYTARALHASASDRKRHEDMGFHQGWSQCLDQLVASLRR
jgi:uncharacterized glyoxalase superfamily protein PhnB